FGGLGLPVEGHLWWNKRNWGYRTYKSKEELHRNYETLIKKLGGLIPRGLAAAIYTQTTDVEGEVNGLMTYDRVPKFEAKWMRQR
ncbi:MAG: beta-galactosidase, partial [Akkermansiaceae bacterium]|nr:beta-galactosidase [Akkermansiaceae bacterium]